MAARAAGAEILVCVKAFDRGLQLFLDVRHVHRHLVEPGTAAVAQPEQRLGLLGTMMVQRLELAGPRTLRAGAHAISIGLAFALAFVAYTTAAHVAAPWALALVAAATAFAALTLLRDVRASRMTALGLVGATVVIVTELAFVLAGGPTAPWMCAALLVLVLYAASGASHAVLDMAPRHVYVEVALVTTVGLVAVLVGAARA